MMRVWGRKAGGQCNELAMYLRQTDDSQKRAHATLGQEPAEFSLYVVLTMKLNNRDVICNFTLWFYTIEMCGFLYVISLLVQVNDRSKTTTTRKI